MKNLTLNAEQAAELLRTVRDDLIYLSSLNFKKPTYSEVRIASSILRRLLNERMYIAGWTVAKLDDEPTVIATDLNTMIEDVPARCIHYAYAGGAKTDGAQHTGYFLLVIPKAEHEKEGAEATAKRVQKTFKPDMRRSFSVDEFCASPCVASGAARVSRAELIWYVANKRGGVHWDNERGEWTNPVDARNRLLDEDHLLVGKLPASLYETLSIAEALTTSDDCQKFIDYVAEIAPEKELSDNVIKFREGRIGKYSDLTFNPKIPEVSEKLFAKILRLLSEFFAKILRLRLPRRLRRK